jgi:hypothetical protein
MNDLTLAPKSPKGDLSPLVFAGQMQNAPGHPLCRTGIHLQEKELDEQIKTQLACLCVSAPVCTGRRRQAMIGFEL